MEEGGDRGERLAWLTLPLIDAGKKTKMSVPCSEQKPRVVEKDGKK